MPTHDFQFPEPIGNTNADELKSKIVKGVYLGEPEDPNISASTRQMTFGEKLVGLKFNPSNDEGVDKAKRLCAELMDLVQEHGNGKETTQLENILYQHTVGEILNAQMNVVKLLTLKY